MWASCFQEHDKKINLNQFSELLVSPLYINRYIWQEKLLNSYNSNAMDGKNIPRVPIRLRENEKWLFFYHLNTKNY